MNNTRNGYKDDVKGVIISAEDRFNVSYTSEEQVRALEYLANCEDVSQFLSSCGRINISAVLEVMDQEMGRKIIENHKYAITQIPDGRWQTYVEDAKAKNGRKLLRKADKAALEKELIKYYKDVKSGKNITIEYVAYKWLDYKRSETNFKPSSADRYENQYKRIFGEIKDMPIRSFSQVALEDYFVKLITENKITTRVWNDFKTVIRGIFKYAKRYGYSDVNIEDILDYVSGEKKAFTLPKKKSNRDEVFTDKEVEKIEAYIYGRKNISLTDLGVVFGFLTGLRVGELAGLKHSDFELENYKLNVCRTERHYKDENGHTIYVFSEEGYIKADHIGEPFFLTDRAIEVYRQIWRMNPFGEYLFKTDHFIRSQAFTKRVNYICKKIGIKPRPMHKARKTYATRLISGGASEIVVQAQLRHNDISTTRRYYYKNNKTDEETLLEVKKAVGQY